MRLPTKSVALRAGIEPDTDKVGDAPAHLRRGVLIYLHNTTQVTGNGHTKGVYAPRHAVGINADHENLDALAPITSAGRHK
jgi:hypothetical protein